MTELDNTTLKAYRIPFAAKEQIEEELRILGINEFSIFGDLPWLAARLRIAHEVG